MIFALILSLNLALSDPFFNSYTTPIGDSQSTAPTLKVDNLHPTIKVSPDLWGIFFEEINHAGEGGLLAQYVQNPRFHLEKGNPFGWQLSEGAKVAEIGTDGELRLIQGSSATNSGFWGIPLVKGQMYTLTLKANCPTDARILVTLPTEQGGENNELIPISLKSGMNLIKRSFKAINTYYDSVLKLTCLAGNAGIDFVSLTPDKTFHNHGLRVDLADKVNLLNPSFVRFPGGNYIEGVKLPRESFNWKSTITSPWNRPGHEDDEWGYWSTDDLGYYEYLEWCDDMNAKPIYVINCGMALQASDPVSEDADLLQSALNAIHFANDPASTFWGKKRTEMGHKKPFNIRYVEIGNENGIWSGQKQYPIHYRYFYNALKKEFPKIRYICDVRGDYPADIVDDHIYSSSKWFWDNDNKYASYSRSGPKVYVGEYAVTQDCGTGNLRAALAEAAYMTGLEKNSDLVVMASYAPLFVNVKFHPWDPDLIRFNNHESLGTSSYWVQYLFSNHRMTQIVPLSIPKFTSLPIAQPKTVQVGVGTWNTKAEFSNFKLKVDGLATNYSTGSVSDSGSRWLNRGNEATNLDEAQPALRLYDFNNAANIQNYTYSVDAKKISGSEGFLICVKCAGSNRTIWWNIGGWNNTVVAAEKRDDGTKTLLTQKIPYRVQTGKTYAIQVKVHGNDLELFIDGKFVQEATDSSLAPSHFTGDAGLNSHHQLIVRLVNGDPVSRTLSLAFAKSPFSDKSRPQKVQEIILTAKNMDDENSFANPRKVAPVEKMITIDPKNPTISIPAQSFIILTFGKA